jgi:hypothetical protein
LGTEGPSDPAPVLEKFLGVEGCSNNDVSLIVLPRMNRHGARHHSLQLGSVVLFRKLADQQALRGTFPSDKMKINSIDW